MSLFCSSFTIEGYFQISINVVQRMYLRVTLKFIIVRNGTEMFSSRTSKSIVDQAIDSKEAQHNDFLCLVTQKGSRRKFVQYSRGL